MRLKEEDFVSVLQGFGEERAATVIVDLMKDWTSLAERCVGAVPDEMLIKFIQERVGRLARILLEGLDKDYIAGYVMSINDLREEVSSRLTRGVDATLPAKDRGE